MIKRVFGKYKTVLLTAVILAYLVGAGILAHDVLRESRVKKVNIIVEDSLMNSFVTADDISGMLEDSGIVLMGKLCDSVNTYKIEKIIDNNSMVKKSEVYVTYGGEVYIRIWQRNPIVRIITYDKESYYIDEDGYLMPYVDAKPGRVLVVTGKIDAPLALFDKNFNVLHSEILFNRDTLLKEIYELSEYIYNNSFWRSNIEQIYVQSENEYHLIPKVGSFLINFGDIKDYKKKFRNLFVFYKDVLPKVGWNTYETVDLRFENQIVCKKIKNY